MKLTGLDHIVLCVRDLEATIGFYRDLLGMEPREERAGKWSLHFGANKISLQDAIANPDIARDRCRERGTSAFSPRSRWSASRPFSAIEASRSPPGRASEMERPVVSFRSTSATPTVIWSR